MTHDPLCPFRPAQSGKCDRPFSDPNISCAVLHVSQREVPCQCALIARVRADERAHMGIIDLAYKAGVKEARKAINDALDFLITKEYKID